MGRASARHGRRRVRRAGSVRAIELVIALPILIMMVIAGVQFGLLFANLQQLSMGARAGSVAASQSPQIAQTVDGGTVPSDVIEAIEQHLDSSGIEWCRIRVEHNLGGTTAVLISEPDGPCECGPTAPLATPPFAQRAYVRVTVCSRLTELMPDCLTLFGFSLAQDSRFTGFTSLMPIRP